MGKCYSWLSLRAFVIEGVPEGGCGEGVKPFEALAASLVDGRPACEVRSASCWDILPTNVLLFSLFLLLFKLWSPLLLGL